MEKSSYNKMPYSVIHRLPKYLIHVQKLVRSGRQWVSSQDIAHALGLTSSTVRQDLSYIEFSGISKKGYEIKHLESSLLKELDIGKKINMVIIGAGNLGKAVALNNGFHEYGFKVQYIFDNDPSIIGQRIGDLIIEDMVKLETVASELSIDIGILTVPAAAAQEVADRLMAAGVRGILNFTSAHIVTNTVAKVIDSRIIANLLELNCLMGRESGQLAG